MEIPDIRTQAIENLKGLEKDSEGLISIIQIGVTEKGHCTSYVAGFPAVIVQILTDMMKDNHQFRDMVEEAWCNSAPNIPM